MATRPTAGQLEWQEKEFGMFCHFGINTFFGKEWSNGKLSPEGFDPSRLDARQWVRVAQDAGMRYLVLTAKHHDGFCLWQTATTDYSVRSSPFQGGKGDVVGEVAAACSEMGMPLGLYLSPWDRHEPCYSDPEAYDQFYCRQLTELCTRFGPLFEVWFDGAGSEGRTYNWDAFMEIVNRYQPGAMVFEMGRPTIRWIGNEDGLAADPCYYVAETDDALRRRKEGGPPPNKTYLPPECDVAIRQHWFWQPDDIHTLKTAEHLLGIYYRSVGRGANLLLNVPPDRNGLICPQDAQRLGDMTRALRKRFACPFPGRIVQQGKTISVTFDEPRDFDHLVLREDIADGQCIDGYEITCEPHGTLIDKGQTIGNRKFHAFAKVRAQSITITVNTEQARLRQVVAYCTGAEQLPAVGSPVNYEDWKHKADLPVH